jgi:hypothetical protein
LRDEVPPTRTNLGFGLRYWFLCPMCSRKVAIKDKRSVPMFLGASLAAFFIAEAVIIARTYRAAAANPADSIRYE